MLEYRFDTQLLIAGENLSEDEIMSILLKTLKETACLQLVMMSWLKFIFTQTLHGKYLSIVLHSEIFMMLS